MKQAPQTTIRVTAGDYKSIGPMEWVGVPDLAILTGVNGSGKTQFLELLNAWMTKPKNFQQKFGATLTWEGFSPRPDRVVFLHGEWNIAAPGPVGAAQIQGAAVNIRNLSTRNAQLSAIRKEIERKAGTPLAELSEEEFFEHLPVDFALVLSNVKINEGVEQVFYHDYLRRAQAQLDGMSLDEIEEEFGRPSWETLNDILARTGFRYRVTTPDQLRLTDQYALQAQSLDGLKLPLSDLSSGERVLLSLMFWLYTSEKHGRLPELLLLDEPDAHLHPAMTDTLLRVLNDVLVGTYGMRCIMTTHSPSTVALAPEDSLFEMLSKGPERIVPVTSKSRAVSQLTSGLVTVGPGTKFVLVEDQDDADFLGECYRLLVNRDEVIGDPSIVFVPASLRDRGGGRTVVEGWTEKLREFSALGEGFFGITDNDGSPSSAPGVFSLTRHSLENYLLDPLHVFAVLLDQGVAPEIEGIEIGIGDEHKILDLHQGHLQDIVDAVLEPVAQTLQTSRPIDDTPVRVSVTSEVSLEYPTWLFEHRGKDLMPIFQSVYSAQVHPTSLLKALKRDRIVPLEIGDLFRQILSGH